MGEVVDGLIEIKPQDIKRIAEGPEKPMYSWGLRGRGNSTAISTSRFSRMSPTRLRSENGSSKHPK